MASKFWNERSMSWLELIGMILYLCLMIISVFGAFGFALGLAVAMFRKMAGF